MSFKSLKIHDLYLFDNESDLYGIDDDNKEFLIGQYKTKDESEKALFFIVDSYSKVPQRTLLL